MCKNLSTTIGSLVCGLVPIPPMFGTVIDSRGNLHGSCKGADLWQLVFLPDHFTERVVNREELARAVDTRSGF